jgi:replicative DNA helicase
LNIASALLKQVIALSDAETWSYVRRSYLPAQYHRLFDEVDRHLDQYHELPSFDDLKLSIRDKVTLEKVLSIESIQVDVESWVLLDYLKNEFAQKEILSQLESYIDDTVTYATAEESVEALHNIILHVEEKVDLERPQESMQRITLFEPEEELEKYVALGLNAEYDFNIKFSPKDLILIGGRRGSGKSLTCANIVNSVYQSGKSAMYFTIEMDSRQTLQRICSVATGVSFKRIKSKNLSVSEWECVANWWAGRFTGGQEHYENYTKHRDFDNFHHKLTTTCELLPTKQIDVVYDPSLTLGKIRAELDKKVKKNNVGVVIVDYINQVKRSNLPSRTGGQYDWTEQIEVSKALKSMAQDYEVPIVSPYQVDATGEARFAKGILDAADAAFTLETFDHEDGCMEFKCVKMRNNSEESFVSAVNWDNLRIGPESALTPAQREETSHKVDEDIHDFH